MLLELLTVCSGLSNLTSETTNSDLEAFVDFISTVC